MAKRRGLGTAKLGRGEGSIESGALASDLLAFDEREELVEVPLEAIDPNRWQPRVHFDESGLRALADEIARDGLLHPPVVRRVGGRVQIAVGERRIRAVRMLGWRTVSVRVRELSDREMRRVAWAENLAREDLSAWEQAQAILRAQQELESAGEPAHQRALAAELGVSLGTVSELLRVARAFPTPVVERLHRKIEEAVGSSLNAESSPPTIHDMPRDRLVRFAKLQDEVERIEAVRRTLSPRAQSRSGEPRAGRAKSRRLKLDPLSYSPAQARQLLPDLLGLLPSLIARASTGDPDGYVTLQSLTTRTLVQVQSDELSQSGAARLLSEVEPQIRLWLDRLRQRAAAVE